MMSIKQSPEVPTPDDVRSVAIRTVDDQPAIVFVCHDGARIVVPVSMRPVSRERVAA